jgi:hypothetical protein
MHALRSYQWPTIQALMEGIESSPGATFTVMFPRQSGKNELAAVLVAYLLRAHAARGGTVVVCAPTLTPQARISFERVRLTLATAEPEFRGAGPARLAGDTIHVGQASAVFLSASREAHVAGHTASLALIADEAQDIDADWFDRQFRPMAAATGASTVMFGTAWNGETMLERAVAANRMRDAAGRPARHFQVSWEEVARSRPIYGDYVLGERDRLGASHPLFLSQYELVASEAEGRLLSRDQLARLGGGHRRLDGPLPGERYVAGLDFAGDREGGDATVLTIARVQASGRAEVVCFARWLAVDYAVLLQDLIARARGWRLERLCVDGSGLGNPLGAALERELGPRVERVVFTAGSKSELGYSLMAAANTGTLVLFAADHDPDLERCYAELRACRVQLGESARLDWGAGRGHDDYPVSLALCLRAAQSLGAPRIAVGRARG